MGDGVALNEIVYTMETIKKSIEVEAPLHEVYDQWSHFAEFPRFMEGVQSVTKVDSRHLHWVAEVGGQRREWDAEIDQQVSDQKIAWHSTGGAVNSGTIDFLATDPQHTLIKLRMDYKPQGMIERMGSSLGILSRRVEGDLERFKQHIQKHETSNSSRNTGSRQTKPNLAADYDTSGKSGV